MFLIMPCILSAVVSTNPANRIGVCMNPNDLALVKSGVILLIAGMGMTFIFLIIQIICTNISSKVSAKFAHLIQEPEPKKPAKKPAAAAAPKSNDAAIIAAIAAALHHHNA